MNEGSGANYVFTATLSAASEGVTTIHTDQGDISIADGATTGTLTIASGNGEDVYSDASSLTAHITGVSGGNFESLTVGSGTATANVIDTVTPATVTLDDAVAGGAPGTATITAHIDNAVTGSDLHLNLSNGTTITIAVGATSGTSAAFAATADATIGVNSVSGGNFEALVTSDTALMAVNDAPVNALPGAQTVAEDTNLAITGLSISDTDAGSASNITTTLSVAHGTLTVSSAGGAAVSGSGTGSVTLTGSIAQINTTLAAINNVVYKGVLDFNGSDTLTITTNDHGNTGIDPGLTGTASSEQDSELVGNYGHGRQRRSGGDDHAGELRGDRADEPHAQGHRPVDQPRRRRRGCRLRLHERDACRHRRHAECGRRHQRRIGLGQWIVVGDHHGHGGAGQRTAEHEWHEQRSATSTTPTRRAPARR